MPEKNILPVAGSPALQELAHDADIHRQIAGSGLVKSGTVLFQYQELYAASYSR